MSYQILFDPGAAREFGKLTKQDKVRTTEIIDSLANDPRPTGAEKLTGIDAYKIRTGDLRIVYGIRDEQLIVLIVRVGNRREVYKNIESIKQRLKKK